MGHYPQGFFAIKVSLLSIEAKDNAAEKIKSMDQEIKTLGGMRDELKVEVDKTKKELARQGKIIMKRQPDSS
jgi:peptidoglycan hydrolase CwlO-like protein